MKNRRFIIFTLGVLAAIGPFSIDMYLPAFTSMAAHLNTTIPHIQLSLTSYFIGISAGQLVFGPLIDRFGRIIPLYIGLGLFLITTLACAFAPSADALIVLRFFQALGSCAGMVISRAMVRDLFPVEENAKIFSLLMLVIGVSPILAPSLGGYLTTAFGWRSIFFFLTALAAITLWICYKYLYESKAGDKAMSLRPKQVMGNFSSVLKNKEFLFYAGAGGVSSAGMFAYISGSTFVFVELFGLNETEFGWLFAFNAAGLILSSQLNSLVLNRLSSENILQKASIAQIVFAAAMIMIAFAGELTLIPLVLLLFLYMCTQGFYSPNTSALALAPFTKRTGIAAALMGSFRMLISAVASLAVSVLHNNTSIPMLTLVLICAVCSAALVWTAKYFATSSLEEQ